MNRWSVIRANVIAALEAVPALAGIPVVSIATPTDVWAAIPEGTGIGVARRGTTWNVADHDLNYYVDQPASIEFDVVVKTDSPKDNTDGLTGEGQSEDLAAAVLSMRPVSVGVAGETGDAYLTAIAERVVISKYRADGGAGPIAQILTFRTTTLPL